MPGLRVLFLTCCLLSANACSTLPRIASSVPIAANSMRTLTIQGELPHEVSVQLWNRGPGTVSYRTPDGSQHGEMLPDSGDIDWQVHGTELVIELRCGDTPATIGYTARSDGSMSTSVGR